VKSVSDFKKIADGCEPFTFVETSCLNTEKKIFTYFD